MTPPTQLTQHYCNQILVALFLKGLLIWTLADPSEYINSLSPVLLTLSLRVINMSIVVGNFFFFYVSWSAQELQH